VQELQVKETLAARGVIVPHQVVQVAAAVQVQRVSMVRHRAAAMAAQELHLALRAAA
jgi:hypothetical protein